MSKLTHDLTAKLREHISSKPSGNAGAAAPEMSGSNSQHASSADDAGDSRDTQEASTTTATMTTKRQQQSDVPSADQLATRVEPLGLNHLTSVLKLESATFPPQEAASREKFVYRLTKCGELSLGLFTSATPESQIYNALTAASGPPADSDFPDRREVLLGHVFATKTANATVADADMEVPADETQEGVSGHNEAGRTLALHSLAILPEFQGQGLGRRLLKAYVQRMEESGLADRIALLTHEGLVTFYEGCGFEMVGESASKHGGGGWFDMIRELKTPKPGESPPGEEE